MFERVTLPTAVDLRRVSEWASIPVQTLQELNPELRRWTTPLRATDYELKVPEGTAELVRVKLAETDPGDLAPLNHHTVKKGETLLSISRTLSVSRADLAEANYLTTTAKLKTGQQLIIPRAPTLLLATQTDNPVPLAESRSIDTVVAASAVVPAVNRTSDVKLVHRVKSGETLFSIAKLYRTTVASLKQWNHLRSNTIQTGQRLTILAKRALAATN